MAENNGARRKEMAEKYKSLYKEFKGQKEIPKTVENEDLKKDIENQLSNLLKVIEEKDQYFSMRWIMGLENYINTLNNRENRKFNYLKRGDIVMIELFGHFNTEITFLRPSVILYEERNRVLIAPISTGKKNEKKLHLKMPEELEYFEKNSKILLDEIYMIDKKRIVYTKKDKYKTQIRLDDNLLNQIDSIILENYLSYYKQQNDKNIELIRCENRNLKNELDKLKKELDELKNVEKTPSV